MKKNSNRNHRKKEVEFLTFADISGKSARIKKFFKEKKEENK